MIRAVIFDMYETLVTMTRSVPYKGTNIAKDLGLAEAVFREVWNPADNERTLGKTTFEDTIRLSMKVNDCFSESLLQEIIRKRQDAEREYFNHLNSGIIPMLQGLKERNVKVALISNCYLEERDVIKQSKLWPYFDVACMSCELGMKKPQIEIFEICLEKLGLKAEECLYVGDGGSRELETAQAVGMKAAQATWYLCEGFGQLVGRKPEFEQLEKPEDVLGQV